jgi:hypothetical protein
VVTIYTTGANVHKFYVLPIEGTYLFSCISEEGTMISLYSIKKLVSVTETECVYFAVGTEYLNITHVNLSLKIGAVPQLWPLVAGFSLQRPGF